MNQSTIHWGIIGCGNVTEVKSGPAFNKVDGSELLAVMRRDAAKAADYAERHRAENEAIEAAMRERSQALLDDLWAKGYRPSAPEQMQTAS